MEVAKRSIITHPEKCAGCLSCQLICSFTSSRLFNPLKAAIQVDLTTGVINKITFTEDCTDCGVCVDYCHYGCLELKKER